MKYYKPKPDKTLIGMILLLIVQLSIPAALIYLAIKLGIYISEVGLQEIWIRLLEGAK